jgi:Tfp pilus assembly protein PilX
MKRESGAALILSLLLLLIIMIIGVGSVSVVTSSAASNVGFVDRGNAYQEAESTLRLAESIVFADTWSAEQAYDCINNSCSSVPPDIGYPGFLWVNLSELNTLRAGLEPQYFIERIRQTTENESQVGSNNAAGGIYGSESSSSAVTYVYYRVTARSHDPSSSDAIGRSYVRLQSVVKRGG